MRSINTRLALIPEWIVEDLEIQGVRQKVGNAYILGEKELNQVEGAFFALKVISLGGIPIDYNEARLLLNGEKEPYYFDDPRDKEEEVVDEDTVTDNEIDEEPVSKEDLPTEDFTDKEQNDEVDNETMEETPEVDKELEE